MMNVAGRLRTRVRQETGSACTAGASAGRMGRAAEAEAEAQKRRLLSFTKPWLRDKEEGGEEC